MLFVSISMNSCINDRSNRPLIGQFIHLSVHPSIHPLTNQLIYYSSIYPSIYPSIHTSINQPMCTQSWNTLNQFIHPFIHPHRLYPHRLSTLPWCILGYWITKQSAVRPTGLWVNLRSPLFSCRPTFARFTFFWEDNRICLSWNFKRHPTIGLPSPSLS